MCLALGLLALLLPHGARVLAAAARPLAAALAAWLLACYAATAVAPLAPPGPAAAAAGVAAFAPPPPAALPLAALLLAALALAGLARSRWGTWGVAQGQSCVRAKLSAGWSCLATAHLGSRNW